MTTPVKKKEVNRAEPRHTTRVGDGRTIEFLDVGVRNATYAL